MSKILSMTTYLKRKIVMPKVYAVEMKTSNKSILWMGVAYSLEEAIRKARNMALKEYTSTRMGHWSVGKYTYESLETLVVAGCDLQLKPEETWETKDVLMKKIIDTKDKKLFDANRSRFTTTELQLLQDKLNV